LRYSRWIEAKAVALHQVKVHVLDLEVGMYVASLDRPWLGTPFPLQGFYITGYEDVEKLKPYCNHVYVDIERGNMPRTLLKSTQPFATPANAKRRSGPKVAPLKIKRGVYPKPTPIRKEIHKATRAHDHIHAAVERFMDRIRAGGALDLIETRRVIKHVVSSVIRNPDALIWLAKIRDRDQYAYGHCVRSTIWATVFGRHLGLAREGLETLALGVLLSKVGYTRLPRALVTKTEPLSAAEEEFWRRHVTFGVDILRRTPGISDLVVSIVAAHQERHDGNGFPRGLKGDQIPYLAKIAGIVDCYDGLRYPRDEPRALSSSEAMSELYRLRDVDFQAELVEEFIKAIGIYPAGTLVELSTREIGLIVEQHETRRLSPKVVIVLDKDKQPLETFQMVDLTKGSTEKKHMEIVRSLGPRAFNIEPQEVHDIWFGRRWRTISAMFQAS
jgi:HD-GYP domain-containing protein (c-di-GMP phosphodiesterase class II)